MSPPHIDRSPPLLIFCHFYQLTTFAMDIETIVTIVCGLAVVAPIFVLLLLNRKDKNGPG